MSEIRMGSSKRFHHDAKPSPVDGVAAPARLGAGLCHSDGGSTTSAITESTPAGRLAHPAKTRSPKAAVLKEKEKKRQFGLVTGTMNCAETNRPNLKTSLRENLVADTAPDKNSVLDQT